MPKNLHTFMEKSRKYRFQKGQFTKEKHRFWKGGITPLTRSIRHLEQYNQWRIDIFERDNFICQLCGQTGKLHADHYPKMFWQIIAEDRITSLEEALSSQKLWDINNGRTLCVECHRKTTAEQMRIYWQNQFDYSPVISKLHLKL